MSIEVFAAYLAKDEALMSKRCVFYVLSVDSKVSIENNQGEPVQFKRIKNCCPFVELGMITSPWLPYKSYSIINN